MTDASLGTETVVVGEPVTVEVTLQNSGVLESETTVALTVDGETVTEESVTVGGDGTTVTVERSFEAPGEYALAVDGVAAGTVTVERAIRVREASLERARGPVGTRLPLLATIRNHGPAAVGRPVTVTADGDSVATRTVEVDGETTREVRFEPSVTEPGRYDLAVEDVPAGTGQFTDTWREFGHDGGNTGRTRTASPPTESGTEVWRRDFLDGTRGSPVVVGDTVYLGLGNPYAADDSGSVVALEAATGETRWRKQTGGRVDFPPSVVAGYVVCGANTGQFRDDAASGRVRAFDRRDGRAAWTVDLDAPVAGPPAASERSVYVSTTGGRVYAIDATDGTVRWTENVETRPSAPAVTDRQVFVGGRDGRVRALGVEDGTVRWQVPVEGRIESSPTAVDGTVYVASRIYHDRYAAITGGTLAAIPTDGGEPEWTTTVDESLGSSLAVGEDGLFAGVGLSIWGFERADGSVRWRGPSADAGTGTTGAPAVVDGTVYGGLGRVNGGYVVAFDAADGSERWRTEGDAATSAPAVGDGRLYVGVGFGELLALTDE
ncbi:PQQ-binding-like beta-propeller repeat protein [Halorientalis pallida]|uniref:outer membrane protein assembly factor BamB family protein n=1 Tax=Halorientalis pallida TaxID=2479928 RepID=UPI003C703DF0